MRIADLPPNEHLRIVALHEYRVLDTPPEKTYDDITRLAAAICEAPIAAICLVDANRTWFKSVYGINIAEIPRSNTLCAHAILTPDEVFEVPDIRDDERFFDNPQLGPPINIVSYTAIPLVNPEGLALGALTVIDHKPRKYSAFQIESLRTLALQVLYLMKLKKRNMQLEQLQQTLESKNKELEQFAYVVAHDIKNPVANLLLTSDILKKDYAHKMDEKGVKFLDYLTLASYKVSDLVNGILEFYRTDSLADSKTEFTALGPMLDSITTLLKGKENVVFHYPLDSVELHVNKTALEQIFINLITNAIKYNDRDKIVVSIGFSECTEYYRFTVGDNGRGIPQEYHDKIFDLFSSLNVKDRFNQLGTGIGLATVKKLVERAGGDISLKSEVDIGTEFCFTIKKPVSFVDFSKLQQQNSMAS